MAAVTLTITGRNDKVQKFKEIVGEGSDNVILAKLLTGVRNLQQESNIALTVMVNEEKANNSMAQNKEKSDDSEVELEDDEEDDADVNEPPEKKPKS